MDPALDKNLFSILYAVPKEIVQIENTVNHVPYPGTLPSNDVPTNTISFLQVPQESSANPGSLVFFKPNNGKGTVLNELIPISVITQTTTRK